MNKTTIPAIIIFYFFLLIESAFSQDQKDIPGFLKERFLKYTEEIPREEIFIHTDRDHFISGEDLWFNLYLIDRKSFRPSLYSRIAYFELLNADNKPVLQKRIFIDYGYGPGQIILPDTLSTGTYTIRAYTSWMKNFFPFNCFERRISVYNLLTNEAYDENPVSVDLIKNGTDKGSQTELRYPRISWISFSVNNSQPDFLELYLKADEKNMSENDNSFYIFIQTHGNINYVSSEKLTDAFATISISKRFLSSGINQVTLFNSKCEPVWERFIYTPDKEQEQLTVLSADSYKLRDKITLEIEPGSNLSEATGLTGQMYFQLIGLILNTKWKRRIISLPGNICPAPG